MSKYNSFITEYLEFIGVTESPVIYHRWAALSIVGTILERNYYFNHGHFTLIPNLYVMIMGESGARKSVAIKIAKNVLSKTGFNRFSSEETSKQQFVELFNSFEEEVNDYDTIMTSSVWEGSEEKAKVIAVYADEFNDFVGLNNSSFVSLLGSFWDFRGWYEQSYKGKAKIRVYNPTVNILGGNTASSFSRAFPPELIEQGFFSRLLLIHGDPLGIKITFPEVPTKEKEAKLVDSLKAIRDICRGNAELTPEAHSALDTIYKTHAPVDDVRFAAYNSRRFSHLIKLCLVISACHGCCNITLDHVIEANTILTHAEQLMPKALGQFGKGRNSDTANKIYALMVSVEKPLTLTQIWEHVHQDMEKFEQLGEHMRNLMLADKICVWEGGYIAKVRTAKISGKYIDLNYLTKEEREMKL